MLYFSTDSDKNMPNERIFEAGTSLTSESWKTWQCRCTVQGKGEAFV
jgi:hypothetical protein